MIGDQPGSGYGGYGSGRGLSPTSQGRSPLTQGLLDYSPYFSGTIFEEAERLRRLREPQLGPAYKAPNVDVSSSQGIVGNAKGMFNTIGAAGLGNFINQATRVLNEDKVSETKVSPEMALVIDDIVVPQVLNNESFTKAQQQKIVEDAVNRGAITKTEADKFFGTINGLFPNQGDFRVLYDDDGKKIGYSELLAKNIPSSRNNIIFSEDGKGDVTTFPGDYSFPPIISQDLIDASKPKASIQNLSYGVGVPGGEIGAASAVPGASGMGGSIDIGPFTGVYDGGVGSLRTLLGPNTEAGISLDLNSGNLGVLGSTGNLFGIPGFDAQGTVNQEGDYTLGLGYGPLSFDGSNSQSVLGYDNNKGLKFSLDQDGDITGNFSINDLLGIKGLGAQLNYDSNTGPSGMIGYSGTYNSLDPEAVIDLENPNQQFVAGTGLNPNSYFSSPVSEQLSGKNFSTNSDAISNIRFEDVQKEYAQRMKDSKAQEQVAQAAAQAVQAIQSIPQSQPSLSSSDQAALANQISNNFINTEVLRKQRTPIIEMNPIQIAAAGQQNQEALNRLPKYAREAIRAGRNPMGGSKDIIQDMIIEVLKPSRPYVKAEGER